MPKRLVIFGLRDALKKKITRGQFMAKIDAVVPWARLRTLIELRYPKFGPKGGRSPKRPSTPLARRRRDMEHAREGSSASGAASSSPEPANEAPPGAVSSWPSRPSA